ncbi:Zinc finger protein GLIS2 [Mycena venus]|uniref:Zinc finger protein GLIS2 n=1 Tax=Mycena venus TaxID=2733690 RepID=A0A8H6Y5J0_9AGAR|nr:Zinc finger protein GLIS2 [Mycena venus]
MNARPAYHHSSRDHDSSTSRQGDAHEYSSLREIYPLRPRQEYRAPDSDFPLRPVSPPFALEPSAMVRPHADSIHRGAGTASSHASHHSEYYSSCSETKPERFPAPPSFSVFNTPSATYFWPNFAASSQMKHDPVLYARYHNMSSSSSSSSSDPEDDDYGSTDDRRGVSPRSSRYHRRDDAYTPTGNTFCALEGHTPKREPSVEAPHLNTSPANRLVDLSMDIRDCRARASPAPSRSRTSPSPSISSDLPPTFDIGFPPRQDHRSSFVVGPSHSIAGSRRPSPSTASSVYSGGDPTSLATTRHIPVQMPSPPTSNQNWEDYALQIKHPEGGVAYKCTWTTSEGTCHYWSKKQLVKRHVETTHLKFRPFVCDICSKAFPQKTSLEIHRHGHTGDKPHVCKYDCGKTFKDPARRHRHHVEVHGYVPKQSKRKQQGPGAAYGQEPSPYESLPPLRMNSDINSTFSRG